MSAGTRPLLGNPHRRVATLSLSSNSGSDAAKEAWNVDGEAIIGGSTVVRDSSKGISTLDIVKATSQLVALTRDGTVDPQVSLTILLELRAHVSVLRRLLESRHAGPMVAQEQCLPAQRALAKQRAQP